jgi:hypothetical protein
MLRKLGSFEVVRDGYIPSVRGEGSAGRLCATFRLLSLVALVFFV